MLGGLAPSWWLRHRIKARRDQVTNDLPDLLDLMTISVAAGLGLEQAMQVSCARFESPVCHELRLTLQGDGARPVAARCAREHEAAHRHR